MESEVAIMPLPVKDFTPTHGRVLVEVNKPEEVHKIGSIYAVSSRRKDNFDHFDPVTGTVAHGEHIGKTAFFHKLCYKQALRSQGKIIVEQNEKTYLIIEDSDVFFYLNDGKVEMTKNYCLCEPNLDDWEVITERGEAFLAKKLPSGIYIGTDNKQREQINICKIAHIHPDIAAELGLEAGMEVYLDKACDIPLESELNRMLDKKYFRVDVGNILGIKTN